MGCSIGFLWIQGIFGELLKAVGWKNMVKKLMLNASIYNMFIAINPKGFE